MQILANDAAGADKIVAILGTGESLKSKIDTKFTNQSLKQSSGIPSLPCCMAPASLLEEQPMLTSLESRQEAPLVTLVDPDAGNPSEVASAAEMASRASSVHSTGSSQSAASHSERLGEPAKEMRARRTKPTFASPSTPNQNARVRSIKRRPSGGARHPAGLGQ